MSSDAGTPAVKLETSSTQELPQDGQNDSDKQEPEHAAKESAKEQQNPQNGGGGKLKAWLSHLELDVPTVLMMAK